MAGEPDLSLQGNASGPAGLPCVSAVFLVGFMGSGKTSVGLALSQRLHWPFHDLDDYIQQREGRRIAQIFQESGEAEFRRIERAAVRELVDKFCGSSPAVIALGGGAFVQDEIAATVEEVTSAVVFLDAPVEELWRRCQEAVERPLKQDRQQFQQLYQTRLPSYMRAPVRVDTNGKDVNIIAAEIANRFGLRSANSAKEK